MNLNKVFIIGRVTADPQLRTIPGGQSVTSFSVATNRFWTGKTGGRQEETEFHNVVAWGRQAEIATQFLPKGSLVYVEGRLRTRSWQDKQGQNRRTTEIICERIQLGPRAAQPGGSSPTGGNASRPEASQGVATPSKEELPPLEELPVIDLESEEVKPEDLPF